MSDLKIKYFNNNQSSDDLTGCDSNINACNCQSTPHRCPVCGGNGLVPNGFYRQTSGGWSTISIEPEACRSCGGSGIVWS